LLDLQGKGIMGPRIFIVFLAIFWLLSSCAAKAPLVDEKDRITYIHQIPKEPQSVTRKKKQDQVDKLRKVMGK